MEFGELSQMLKRQVRPRDDGGSEEKRLEEERTAEAADLRRDSDVATMRMRIGGRDMEGRGSMTPSDVQEALDRIDEEAISMAVKCSEEVQAERERLEQDVKR